MQMDNNTFTYILSHHLPYVSIPLDWDIFKTQQIINITQTWMIVVSTTYEWKMKP